MNILYIESYQNHKDIAHEIHNIEEITEYPQTYCTKFHKTVSLDVDLTSEILNDIISEKSKAKWEDFKFESLILED